MLVAYWILRTHIVSSSHSESSRVMKQREGSGVRRISERRIDRRVSLDLPVATFKGGIPKRYRLVDLSCGGAQIERSDTQVPPAVHTLELDLGEGRVMRMLARTVWVRQARYAVSFLALDGFDRLTIAEGIDRLLAVRKATPLASLVMDSLVMAAPVMAS
jgi:hypothetical protein